MEGLELPRESRGGDAERPKLPLGILKGICLNLTQPQDVGL